MEPIKSKHGINIKKMVVVLLGAGKYVKTRIGHELFNMKPNPIDEKFYGYCPDTPNMPINRFGARNADKSIDGILVVYAKKKEQGSDYEITGFAPNATVFREGQSGKGMCRTFRDKNGQEETSGYSVVSSTLYNLENKANKFTITKGKDTNPFRNQRIYAEQHPDLLKKIAAYCENIMDDKEMLDDDFGEQEEIQKAEPATRREIEGSAGRELSIANGRQGQSVRKIMGISKAALVAASFKCLANPGHETFFTNQGKQYMEGHHLIPCTLANAKYYKEKYGKNIDCFENIASLCPTCHRAVHFGDEQTRTKILTKLHALQETKLRSVGIPIMLEELLGLYGRFSQIASTRHTTPILAET
jgi:5-methylcytosine-specific restriction protein A